MNPGFKSFIILHLPGKLLLEISQDMDILHLTFKMVRLLIIVFGNYRMHGIPIPPPPSSKKRMSR